MALPLTARRKNAPTLAPIPTTQPLTSSDTTDTKSNYSDPMNPECYEMGIDRSPNGRPLGPKDDDVNPFVDRSKTKGGAASED